MGIGPTNLRGMLSPNTSASAPTTVTVGTAAVRLDTGLTSRLSVMVQNNGTANVYLGFGASGSTVTTSGATAGLLLPPGADAEFDFGPNIPVYGISTAAGQPVAVLEVA